jgi:hypothetical protein
MPRRQRLRRLQAALGRGSEAAGPVSQIPSSNSEELEALPAQVPAPAGVLAAAAAQETILPAQLPAAAAPVAQAAAPVAEAAAPVEKPFLQRSAADKMKVMANVMQDARGLLDANEVSSKVEQRLAATIPQELSANDARRGLGYTFLKQAQGLQGALKGVDQNDPAAMAKATSKLTEEQRFLLARQQAGDFDVSTLPKDVSDTPAALRDQITTAGVSLRSAQYGEMGTLQERARSEKLGKDDAARLEKLKGIKGLGMKYNGYDPSMGDLSGMSADRFGEIFAPGNSRFEPVQYKKLRDSYSKNKAANDKTAAAYAKDPENARAPSETVLASAGIGDFEVNALGQQRLGQNMDLVADMATSYGPGQIMGGYAQQDYWQGKAKAERLPAVKQADGTSRASTLTELKASGSRMEPTAADIQPMLGLVQMKGIDLDSSPSVSEWISAYNGNPNATQRAQYTNSLNTNGPLYDAAKAALPKPTNG